MKLDREGIRGSASLVLRSLSNWHRPGDLPNVFIFTTPRSGSTWLMELIQSQPGFKCCSEPLNLRVSGISRRLGVEDWNELYQDDVWPKLERYFEGFCSGRLRFLNQSPFIPFYRPYTSRIVAKVLHGGEAYIEKLANSCNARIVFLLRHPIPVSLSREQTPRLRAFLESDYKKHFSQEELALGLKISQSGSPLQKGVLDWCLQNAVPLRNARPEWIVMSYEEMVLSPEPILDRMALELCLPEPSRLYEGLDSASETVRKSDRATAVVLDGPRSAERSRWLVEKWRDRVSESEEREAMQILEHFGIDCYRAGEVLPRPPLWIGPPIESPSRSADRSSGS